jgi:uncharacterized protein YfbU (UPF0304 family)
MLENKRIQIISMKIFDPDNDDKYKQLEKEAFPVGYNTPQFIDVEKELGSIAFKKQGETIIRIDTYDYDAIVLAKKVLDTLIAHAVVIGEMEQMRDVLKHFIVKTTRDE